MAFEGNLEKAGILGVGEIHFKLTRPPLAAVRRKTTASIQAVAQPGRACALGAQGQRFESSQPDYPQKLKLTGLGEGPRANGLSIRWAVEALRLVRFLHWHVQRGEDSAKPNFSSSSLAMSQGVCFGFAL